MKTIKFLRQTLRIKQKDFAKHLGIARSNYSNIENGILIPKNIDKIKLNAIDLLKPEFKSTIADIEHQLDFLKQLYEDL